MKKFFAVALGILTAIGGFVDIGDLVTNAQVGARFGLSLGWVVLLGVLGICVFAEMSGRVAAVSGRATFDIVRERLGPRMGMANLLAVLPGLLLVATGVALSFTPTTMVIAAAMPETHTGLASGMAGSATQVGAALGTATSTAIGMSVSGSSAAVLSPTGFTAAFAAAAVVSLITAVLGCTVIQRRRSSSDRNDSGRPRSGSRRR